MKLIDANKLVLIINKAYDFLNEKKDIVDQLNVFPVPDGDTGTNMTMTMKSGVSKVNSSDKSSVETVSKALSQGTLMGARGNSGVILSQLCRGMSKALKGKNTIEAVDVKEAFVLANKTAYKAVMKPTEGTILTVARKMAEKAESAYREDIEIDQYLFLIITEGQKALLNTPNLLPVLKEAGVVDSGGQGLMYILEGAVRGLNSDFDLEVVEEIKPKNFSIEFSIFANEEEKEELDKVLEKYSVQNMQSYENMVYNAMIELDELDNIFEEISKIGKLLKFEIKTINPETLESVKKASKPKKKYGFIAVSRGEGYDKAFESLNADVIISGGQTMNPSTEDIYKATQEIDAENILIFPNNKNIIMAAKQACKLAENNCIVIETRSIPEAFSALLSFDESSSLEENVENMEEAIKDLSICEVTISVRDTKLNNIEIKKDDYIGIADGKIVASKKTIKDTTLETIEKTVNENTSLITIYYGEDITDHEAKKIHKLLSKKFRDIDVELIYGGQPVYYYTITLE